MTGVTVELGEEIKGKRLQILKGAVPSASKVADLDMRSFWESATGKRFGNSFDRRAGYWKSR